MPAYFILVPKDGDEPAVLDQVDALMRKHFKTCDKYNDWYMDWLGIEGFYLAMGWTFERMLREQRGRPEIIAWLQERYDVNAWARVRNVHH